MSTAALADHVTAREIADSFRVSDSTVKRWVKEGKLPPPVQVGRKLLWRPEVIARLAEGKGPTE